MAKEAEQRFLTGIERAQLEARLAAAREAALMAAEAERRAAVAAAEAITAPASDARGPAHYRTKMAGVMLTRALGRAKARARG